MTTCPAHQTTTPPEPEMPHDPTSAGHVCKGCLSAAGSDEERRSHHCPCCGERFMGSCTGRRQSCNRCGTFDTGNGRWLPLTDPIAALLSGHYTPTPWIRAWEQAASRFGWDVAHHLVQVTTEIDRTHLYGEIVLRRAILAIRCREAGSGPLRFEAASDCPHGNECRGRVWTPVNGREELLDVRLNGPGQGASECDRARRHY
ncbi:hypothetical protein P1P68_02240 [Streptomyces scabiei]|uniref:hypothetical protein n=1 Tax=Streptomyces scabiei TaxID=1930 RepID=UPI00298FC975|nr:hypothetical protein [Streptomyces scabiei]MDW8803654.1 hypothetical protein [Streptomyces scabiei]